MRISKNPYSGSSDKKKIKLIISSSKFRCPVSVRNLSFHQSQDPVPRPGKQSRQAMVRWPALSSLTSQRSLTWKTAVFTQLFALRGTIASWPCHVTFPHTHPAFVSHRSDTLAHRIRGDFVTENPVFLSEVSVQHRVRT